MEFIAFYLGQFHPLEENNKHWGDGFTEWHNVARARPLFPGHAQPSLPGTLGFYDLRLDQTLIAQMDLAAQSGISAFCHWHYWFAGKRVLDYPFKRMVQLGHGRMRHMLGWANESWTGTWHGMPERILLEQTYGENELNEHIAFIAAQLSSQQYFKLDGRAPFLIYKPRLIPKARDYLLRLKEGVARKSGIELYLVGNWGPGKGEQITDPTEFGLDALAATPVGRHFESDIKRVGRLGLQILGRHVGLGPEVRSYDDVMRTLDAAKASVLGTLHATIVTGWDSTPRSGRRGLVLSGFNAETFAEACRHAISLEATNTRRIIFLKSWNEWAEGNVMEPRFREDWSVTRTFSDVIGSSTKNMP